MATAPTDALTTEDLQIPQSVMAHGKSSPAQRISPRLGDPKRSTVRTFSLCKQTQERLVTKQKRRLACKTSCMTRSFTSCNFLSEDNKGSKVYYALTKCDAARHSPRTLHRQGKRQHVGSALDSTGSFLVRDCLHGCCGGVGWDSCQGQEMCWVFRAMMSED